MTERKQMADADGLKASIFKAIKNVQLTLHGNEKRPRAGASWTATHLSTGIASNTMEAMPTSDALCEDNSPISHRLHAGNNATHQPKQRGQLSSAAAARNAKSEQGHQVQRANQNECEQKVPSAFIDACISGNTESVRTLIKKTPSLVSYAPMLCHRYSGLHYAAKGGHHNVVRVLLDNGADVNLRTVGGKCFIQLLELSRLIATSRRDVSARLYCCLLQSGYTALHLAAICKQAKVIEVLLKEYR
uniref:ANK_REP_REGION domain-containing protein n=1 Tax=Ascaris lumbricoides TaxID=6252 RepID=A0A9J2P5V8_ASCLU